MGFFPVANNGCEGRIKLAIIAAAMPELPDVTVYVERIAERAVGHRLQQVRLRSPFVLRTVTPALSEAHGRMLEGVHRLGKRIVLGLSEGRFIVIHLMIAGRFRWGSTGMPIPNRLGLAGFDFDSGTLLMTEAGTRKRASIHFVVGPAALSEFDRGGVELHDVDLDAFVHAMTRERHTLKRALTDPTIVSGIGNAYSDEILHHARLSPLQLTHRLDADQWQRLYDSGREVLADWTARLRKDSEQKFPEKVTAFREDMAVHGRYAKPCPVCGTPIQRIVYADNETNYCPTCQTGGRLLADRSLSRLLRDDWPRSVEELEERRAASVEQGREH